MKNFPKLIIIFLAVDWNLFNRREMVKALAVAVKKHGSTVVAVNRPLCPFTTIITKRHRIKELFSAPKIENLDSNLVLYSPKYFLHDHIAGKFGFLEKLNIIFLRKSFKKLFSQLKVDGERPLVWYYYPQQGYVSEILEGRFLFYELYDELTDVQGREIPQMIAGEKKMKKKVDLFLTVVNYQFKKYSPGYKNSYLFGNGLSRETFESLQGIPLKIRAENEQPNLGYAGMVSDRLDWELIKAIAVRKPEWNLIFHGLITDDNIVKKFESINNVRFHGSYTQEELPSILEKFDIGLLPYLNSDFLNHIHPLKFFEYAAAGLPIVSSPNYELTEFPRNLVQMPEHNADRWIAVIEQQLSADRLDLKRIGIQVAEQYIWDNMCEKLIDKITELYA